MEAKLNLTGWALFVVCAGFFIASAIQDNNIFGLVGSVIFLIGCLVFIFALTRGRKN